MASDTSASFDKCLQKFRRGLTEAQKREFSSTDLPQVKKAIQQIQDRIGPNGKLRNLNRIKKFLEGMKQIEQLVQIFLNVHEVVAFVWGPIKLTLMMISTNVEELDLLLGTYQEIGETLHGVGKYDRLFKNSPDILLILERYFYDILEFHIAVLDVFTKPNWKKFFRSAWPTFKKRFDPILSSLKRHKALLSDEKVSLLLEEVQDGRACIEDRLQDLSKDIKDRLDVLAREIKAKDLDRIELIRNQKSAIEMKLGPHKYNIDQSQALNQRDSATSGDWILHDPKYEAWLNGSLSVDSFLYFSGILGSGKTTLISRIVEYMHSQIALKLLNGVLIFFYFKHGPIGSSGSTKGEMLRAIISQLLHQDDSLLHFIHERTASLGDSTITDDKLLGDLAKDCLKSQNRVWLILDGLDECDELHHDGNMESCDIIKLFEQEFIPAMSAQNSNLRVLVSGQRD
ncbi:hypothetical protein H072_7601 [Dactylellina haptotyla CBS 200.50]|uniref:Uncharacterized protein n=1 Tax=Dactylellina haptotyla (strain CBS 200.50) TaxID=1284197 RepID=S8A6L7_DACHA|nr:hypothetical protein H072_7601 [Dactylellina haptotyla CBS 200.50]